MDGWYIYELLWWVHQLLVVDHGETQQQGVLLGNQLLWSSYLCWSVSLLTRCCPSDLGPMDKRSECNEQKYTICCISLLNPPADRRDHHRVLAMTLTMVQVDQEQCATVQSQCSVLQLFSSVVYYQFPLLLSELFQCRVLPYRHVQLALVGISQSTTGAFTSEAEQLVGPLIIISISSNCSQ